MLILFVFKQVHKRSGRRKDGTEFEVQFQEAEIWRESRRPQVVQIPVSNSGAYQEGLHTIAADSFRPNNFERLEMKYPELVPLEEALQLADRARKALRPQKSI